MNRPSDEQVVDAIRHLRALHPEWRLGQLVANVAMFARGPVESAVWDVEDAEFVAAAEAHLRADGNATVTPALAEATA